MNGISDVIDADGGFDVILGNPPFLNQLESATVAQRGPAAMLQVITGGVIRGYTDLSATFLYFAMQICRTRGRVALVQPQSLLAAKDAGPVRTAVLEDGSLAQLWVSNEHVFESASVFTCAPTIERGGPRTGKLARLSTGSFTSLPDIEIDSDHLMTEETWGHLVAAALGIPEFEYTVGGSVGDIATATADFRDQYYGLEGFLVENADVEAPADRLDELYPPIVTTGVIDLAVCDWGTETLKILKRSWTAPRIDRERMRTDGTLSDWITSRLIPKLILATQTKVLEVFVDETGRFVPSLPLITIAPHTATDLWRLAAAVASPVCSAIAMQKYSGAAMTVHAIKLSAKQTLALPIPEEGPAWDEAAKLLSQAQGSADPSARFRHLLEFARASCCAYRVPPDQERVLIEWWSRRLGEPIEAEEDSDGD